MTESMVTMTITAIVIGAGLITVGALRDRRSSEHARIQFILKASQIKQQIHEDVESAILNNSFTANHNILPEHLTSNTTQKYFGLGTSVLIGPPQNPLVFELQIFKPFNQFFSVPVTVGSSGKMQIIGYQTIPTDSNLKTYWGRALKSADHFVAGNDRFSAIFPAGSTNAASGIVHPLNSGQNASPFTQSLVLHTFSGTNVLRTVEKVRFRFDHTTKELTRTGHRDSNQSVTERIAEGVRSFKVGYSFRKRDENDEAIISGLPTENLSADNLPKTFPEAWAITNCFPAGQSAVNEGQILDSCVKPRNINDVYVQIKIETDLSRGLIGSPSHDHEDMRIRFLETDNPPSQAQVIATVDFRVRPKNFSNSLGVALASGSAVGCEPTMANRCKPECSSTFTSLDRSSPRWIGYGRHVGTPASAGGPSSYCKCWTKTTDASVVHTEFDFSQIKEWRTAGNSPAENEQVEACGREYGCDWRFLWKHPGYRMACDCLRTDNIDNDHFVLRSESHTPTFSNITAPETGGHYLQNLNWQTEPALQDIKIHGPLSRHLRCFTWQVCWSSMTAYFDRIGPESGIRPSVDPYARRCQCLSQDIPYDCNTVAINNGETPTLACINAQGRDVYPGHYDFDKICNRAARTSPDGLVACPHTYKIPGRDVDSQTPQFIPPTTLSAPPSNPYYHFFSNSSFEGKLGTKEHIADACECLASNLQGRLVGDGGGNLILDPQPLNDWNVWLASLDFRVPVNPVTNPAPQDHNSTFATDGSSLDSQTPGYWFYTLNATGNATFNQRTAGPQRLCGQNLCQNFWGSFNTGIHCCTSANATAQTNLTNAADPYSGYCNETCAQWRSPNDIISININNIRRNITGTVTGEELPSWCGGPAAGQGQGSL